MAYRIEPSENLAQGLSRNVSEQLDRAIGELTDGVRADPVGAVHEVRKALKMERSLLRLARGAMKTSRRRRLNAELRDCARRLSGARDADVLIEALNGVAERYAGQVPEPTFAAIRVKLEAERDRLRTELERSGAIVSVAGELRRLRAAVARRDLRGDGWSALRPGLRRSYARGRRAFEIARRDPEIENLHEWRKRVKDLWYHLRLLEPMAPAILKGEIKAAHALSDLLGDDHDLAVLRGALLAMAPDTPADVGPALALTEHRRSQLQEQAWAAGERVYAEKPAAFIRRLKRYWKASRQELAVTAARHGGQAAQLARAAPTV